MTLDLFVPNREPMAPLDGVVRHVITTVARIAGNTTDVHTGTNWITMPNSGYTLVNQSQLWLNSG